MIIWVYLYSSFCGWLRKTHLFCNRVRIGRSRFQGRWLWHFGVCDFLLVINNNVGTISHRFWDTATYWLKIAIYSYPTHLTPSLAVNPFKFRDELFIQKTRVLVLGLFVGEDFVILACVFFTQCQRVADRRMDRRTTRSYSKLCWRPAKIGKCASKVDVFASSLVDSYLLACVRASSKRPLKSVDVSICPDVCPSFQNASSPAVLVRLSWYFNTMASYRGKISDPHG